MRQGLVTYRSFGFPGDDQGWEVLGAALEKYLGELELWNPKLGLVEAIGPELVIKHILDSLSPFGILAELLATAETMLSSDSRSDSVFAMADIGSGAGLPGIPLLLAVNSLMPDFASHFTMTLVEKQQRRVGFLLNAKALLGLGNLIIAQEKLEDLGASTHRYDLVCARAFRPLEPEILGQLKAILKPSGGLFLYKGRKEKIKEELTASALTWTEGATQGSAVVIPLKVPFLDDERHLVLIG